MKIISPELFYKYMITNEDFSNDLSLFAQNTYLDESGNLKEHFVLDISNQSGEWLENQVNSMNTEEDDDEVTYGNFRYISTVIDESAMFPQYSEIFQLEILGLEKNREAFINFFDKFASEFNNHQDELNLTNENGENKTYDITITLGEYSTPDYSEKQDIGGCERFIASVTFVILVTTNLVTPKKVKLYHSYNAENIEIPYLNLKLQRTNELIPDNRAGYEKKYDVNKSDFTMTIGALYTNTSFCDQIMQFAINPVNALTEIMISYLDTSKIETAEDGTISYPNSANYETIISSVDIEYKFGVPISYVVVLKIKLAGG